jgi:Secretion system C-terminal sorting domain
MLIDDVSVYPIDLSNWLPATYSYQQGDTAVIGLPNNETPDAKWYTYNMQLIDSGSQIKVLPLQSGSKYICGIDMCNSMVFDTVTVVAWPLLIGGANSTHSSNYQLYPNPTADGFYIKQGAGANSNLMVEVYDMTGKKVFAQSCTYSGQDCYFYTNLSDGNYVVRITNQATNVHETAKLPIVH